jgi:hypothetical protein
MSVTPAGLAIKQTQQLRQDLRAALAASPAFGPDAKAGPDTVLGQLLDVFAADLSDAWADLQALYDARDPDAATAAALDRLCALVGVIREAQARSTVVLELTTAGTGIIPAGFRARVPGGPIFATTAAAPFVGVPVLVAAEATEYGPLAASAGTITELVDSVVGVTAVVNPDAANPGQYAQADADLRRTREASLVALGAGSDAAIRTSLLALTEVIDAAVRSNRTEHPVDGDRPRSVRVAVWPDTVPAAVIFTVLDRVLPAGIYAEGAERDDWRAFDFASVVPLDITLTLTVDADYPADGDALCQEAMQAYVDSRLLGDDVYPLRVIGAVLAACPGILTATAVLAGGVIGAGGEAVIPWGSIARYNSSTVVR